MTRRVLVVDDNPELRQTLDAILQSLGFEVEVAANGFEALPLLLGGSYDAVLCDLLMPVMDGRQLFAACRKQCPQMSARFVFLSGSISGWETTQFLNDSGQPWLPKPCRMRQLCEGIDAVASAT